MRRILVKRNAYLGDVLQATPLVRALREHFGAEVDFLVTSKGAAALEGNPDVSHVIVRRWPRGPLYEPFDALRIGRSLAARCYDLFVGLNHSPNDAVLAASAGIAARVGLVLSGRKPAGFWRWAYDDVESTVPRQDAIESLLPLVGCPPLVCRRPVIRRTAQDEETASNLLRGLDRPLIAIAAVSRRETSVLGKRNWPLDRWRFVIDVLQGRFDVVLVGDDDSRRSAESLTTYPKVRSLFGRTSIPKLAAVLARCRAIVAVDTMPVFAAASVGCPCVVVYGPEHPVRARPFDVEWIALGGARPDEPRKNGSTLAVTPDQVLTAVFSLTGIGR